MFCVGDWAQSCLGGRERGVDWWCSFSRDMGMECWQILEEKGGKEGLFAVACLKLESPHAKRQ